MVSNAQLEQQVTRLAEPRVAPPDSAGSLEDVAVAVIINVIIALNAGSDVRVVDRYLFLMCCANFPEREAGSGNGPEDALDTPST